MRFLLSSVFILSYTFVHGQMGGTFISQFDRFGDGYRVNNITTSKYQASWKGERVIFQALVWNIKISNPVFSVPDFSGEHDNFPATLLFPTPVKGDPAGKDCGGYATRNGFELIYDALNKDPLNLDTIPAWIRVDVPLDAEPGIYKSRLAVADLYFDMQIEVIDRTLPPVKDWTFHLDLWQFPTRALELYNANNGGHEIDYWSDDHLDMIIPSYKILADAGQRVITAHIKHNALGEPSMIQWIKHPDDSWTYDFSVFDNYVDRLMQIGINKQISCFSPAGWNNTVIPYWDDQSQSIKEIDAPIGSELYAERWDHFLSAFKQHLVQKNWFEISVLYLDEIPENMLTAMYNVIKSNDPGWKLGIAASHGLSSAMAGKFYDASGILGTSTGDAIVKTFYTSCTQLKPNNYVASSSSPSEMTWMAYYAAGNKFNGYLRWAYDNWRLNDPFDARDNGNTAGDFSFIYRTDNDASMKFLSSVRLESLREGIEDFEKIRILKDEGDPEVLLTLNSMLAQFHKNSGMNAATLVPDAHEKIASMFAIGLPITGIGEDEKTTSIKVFPNPFKNEIVVSGATASHLTVSVISPVSGVIALTKSSMDKDVVLSTDSLAKGPYVIEVKSNGNRLTAKLMIKE